MKNSICSIEGCGRKLLAKKLCKIHYERQRRGADLYKEIKIYNKIVQGQDIMCRECKEIKSEEEFYYDKRYNKRRNLCKECCSKKSNEKYKNNKERTYISNKNNRIYLAKEIDKLKIQPCKDCGKIYEPFCMEFDHIENKIESISIMIHNTWSLENIIKEINKTELVCILCHKTRTYNKIIHSTNKIVLRNRDFVLEYKKQPCSICGQNFDPWQMEFDHITGEKFMPISHMITSRYSIKKIKIELEKCRIVCALCHRIETFKKGNYKNY